MAVTLISVACGASRGQPRWITGLEWSESGVRAAGTAKGQTLKLRGTDALLFTLACLNRMMRIGIGIGH